MLRYVQLFLGFMLFAALIGCSAPTTSSRKPIFSSEEEIFKDMTWSGNTGHGINIYLSTKSGQMQMYAVDNSLQKTEYELSGKSSLSSNTWKARFRQSADPNAVYDVTLNIESAWKATGIFTSVGSSSLPNYTLNMGKYSSSKS